MNKHTGGSASHSRHWVLDNSIGYLLRIAFRGTSDLLERRTLEHGISCGQWRFLRQLWVEEGLSQRELSERVGMREPTTVVALKGMEQAGLVRRQQSTSDRRKTHVYLTERAKALETVLLPAAADVHGYMLRGFTKEEVEQLRALLRRLIANVAKECHSVPNQSDFDACN